MCVKIMENKILLGFGVAAIVVLSATQAVNYSLKFKQVGGANGF